MKLRAMVQMTVVRKDLSVGKSWNLQCNQESHMALTLAQ